MGFKAVKKIRLKMNRRTNDPATYERLNKLLDLSCLSPADRNCILEMKKFWETNNYLLISDISYITHIESKYSAHNLENTKKWESEFDNEKKEKFLLALSFYEKSHFYKKIVFFAKKNPGFIPTKSQFRAMVENKYFIKACKNYFTESKYKIGDFVVYRKYGPFYDMKTKKNCEKDMQVYMVEQILEENMFRQNDRRYKLMVLGTNNTVTAYEDEIKIYRAKNHV